jgi:hypothetical protein
VLNEACDRLKEIDPGMTCCLLAHSHMPEHKTSFTVHRGFGDEYVARSMVEDELDEIKPRRFGLGIMSMRRRD